MQSTVFYVSVVGCVAAWSGLLILSNISIIGLHKTLLLRFPIYFFQINAHDQSYELNMLLNSFPY